MYKDERRDAIKLLRTITGQCEDKLYGHGWRKCKRCLAIHGVEERFPKSIELLVKVAEELEQLDKMLG